MRKNPSSLSAQEDRLHKDQGTSLQKPVQKERTQSPPQLLEQMVGARIAQLKKVLQEELQIDAIQLESWCAEHASIPAEKMLMLLTKAKRYGLNPTFGEIACEMSDEFGWQVYIPIDGWMSLIARQPSFQGMVFAHAQQEEHGVPIWMECSIYRTDRVVPMTVREYFSEVKTQHPAWQQMPRRMLRHKTLQQCARLAFGICASELYFSEFQEPSLQTQKPNEGHSQDTHLTRGRDLLKQRLMRVNPVVLAQ
jgi:hypothetical protein